MAALTTGVSNRARRRDWQRLLGIVLPYWRPLALALALTITTSLLRLALPLGLRLLIDTVFVVGDFARLNYITLGLIVLFICQTLLSMAQGYVFGRVGLRLIADLQLRLYNHLQLLPLHFFAKRRTGEIISRLTNDVTEVRDAVTQAPTALLQLAITFAGGLSMMLFMNWRLTLLALAMVPPLIAGGAFFGRRVQRLSTDIQDQLADTTTTLEELLSGIRVVKSFAREAHERQRYAGRVETVFSTAMRRMTMRAIFGPLTGLVGFGGVAALLWYGGRQVIQGTFTPGDLVAFLFYMGLVTGPLDRFAGLYGTLREGLGAAQRLFEMLDVAEESLDPSAETMRYVLNGSIHFEGVSFGYDSAQPMLKDIWLDVQPGEVLALVGPSGAGKTTLVNLIPRFYNPTSGRILIDEQDLQAIDLRDLREQIGLVPQETFLFGGTIRENIAYGQPGAEEAAIVAAACAANAHDFITGFPDGYDTIVGEKGIRLSVGQRQRIAIARVLLKDPRILILDEATSALDSESERLVQEALERLMERRTTFVIAHRLSTIQRAHRIVVLKDGQVVEEGRHSDLLLRNGLYQRLWSLQFAESQDV